MCLFVTQFPAWGINIEPFLCSHSKIIFSQNHHYSYIINPLKMLCVPLKKYNLCLWTKKRSFNWLTMYSYQKNNHAYENPFVPLQLNESSIKENVFLNSFALLSYCVCSFPLYLWLLYSSFKKSLSIQDSLKLKIKFAERRIWASRSIVLFKWRNTVDLKGSFFFLLTWVVFLCFIFFFSIYRILSIDNEI